MSEQYPWEVRQGDSLNLMASLPDGSIDFIFTDPPYGHNNNNGDLISRWELALGKATEEAPRRPIANDGQEANDLFRQALQEFRRLLAPGGCCCCCCAGGGPDPQFARWSMWMDEALDFKQMVVWDKGPMGMGWHYRRSYEVVLVAQKPGAACRWYDTSHRVENVLRWCRKIIPSSEHHPTEKPPELASHFIQLHTKPGDLVLDPFCGAGSTGVAAQKLGRRFLGMELDEHWAMVARERLKRESRQLSLLPLADDEVAA